MKRYGTPQSSATHERRRIVGVCRRHVPHGSFETVHEPASSEQCRIDLPRSPARRPGPTGGGGVRASRGWPGRDGREAARAGARVRGDHRRPHGADRPRPPGRRGSIASRRRQLRGGLRQRRSRRLPRARRRRHEHAGRAHQRDRRDGPRPHRRRRAARSRGGGNSCAKAAGPAGIPARCSAWS